MELQQLPYKPSAMVMALTGPFLMGAVLGLRSGLNHMLSEGLLLPAIIFGVTVVMAPALYIGMSLIGAGPPAENVLQAFAHALRSCGLVLAGFAPATAFLLATAKGIWAVWVFGFVAVAAAALLGVRRLFHELRDEHTSMLRKVPLYVAWALVSLGLGVHFFLQTLSS